MQTLLAAEHPMPAHQPWCDPYLCDGPPDHCAGTPEDFADGLATVWGDGDDVGLLACTVDGVSLELTPHEARRIAEALNRWADLLDEPAVST